MLKDTLSKFFKVDSLLSNLTGYVEARVELIKVEVKEDLTKGLAQAVAFLFIAFVFALFVVFASIAISLFLSARFGTVAGFFTVGLFYLVTAAILWFSRRRIISKLENHFAIMFRKKQ